jgi:hypothetical protein
VHLITTNKFFLKALRYNLLQSNRGKFFMPYNTEKQLYDADGLPLKLQYWDEVEGKYKPGGNPGGGGGGGGGDATAANQVAIIGSKAPGTAAASSQLGGGVYSSSIATLTAGQQIAQQVDERGSQRVRVHATTMTPSDGYSNTVFCGFNGPAEQTGGTRPLVVGSVVYNGATWDRLRGNIFGINVLPAKITGTDRSATIGTSSTILIPAGAQFFTIINDTATDLWLRYGAAATATAGGGNFKIAAGARYTSDMVVDQRDLYAVAAASAAITAWSM